MSKDAEDIKFETRHGSLVFCSDVMDISVNRENKDLEYNLHVPLMVFKNTNWMTDGKPDSDIETYAPLVSMYKEVDPANFLELQTHMRHPDYFEIMFLLEGELEEKINEKINIYKPGGCRIAYKNTRHLERFDKDFSAIYFCISPEMISRIRAFEAFFFMEGETEKIDPVLAGFLGININKNETGIADYLVFTPQGDPQKHIGMIESIASNIKAVYESPFYGSTFCLNGILGKLLTMLSDPSLYSTKHIELSGSKDAAIFNRVSSKLLETKGQISRCELEKDLNYSGSYISRIVKKYSGKTFFDYSMTFCMEEAANRISHSTGSISEIASDLGFSNRTHFYNQFKKIYNVTPNEFRKMNSAKTSTGHTE